MSLLYADDHTEVETGSTRGRDEKITRVKSIGSSEKKTMSEEILRR